MLKQPEIRRSVFPRFSEAIPLPLQQAVTDPRIRSYQASDYELLALWMQDLGRFYDGHDEQNRLLDQLVGAEIGDRAGFFTKNKFMFVCQVAEAPAGMLCLNYKRGGSAKIGPVIVNPEIRGQGVGTSLMRTADEVAKAGEVRKLYATTSHLNTHVNHLFTKAGFQVEAQFPDQYKKGSVELIWGKQLQEPESRAVITQSALVESRGNQGTKVQLLNGEIPPVISQANEIYQQWHDDLGADFVVGMLDGVRRGLNFQQKGKAIILATEGETEVGMVTYTPKRGGPVKLYPLYGTAQAQEAMIDQAVTLARHGGSHKLYTFAHVKDQKHLDNLERLGFTARGVLLSPYKSGHNLIALDKMVD